MSSITIWNRLEPRARSLDMTAGLEARVHDPLWLLARQWQMGEFAGRDAGSPVSVSVQTTATALDRVAVGTEAGRPYDGQMPLETLVEQESVRPASASADLRQAVEAGLHFQRLLGAAGVSRLRALYLAKYPLLALTDADADTRQFSSVVAGRVVDGVRLYRDVSQAGNVLPPTPAVPDADAATVLDVLRRWRTWYEALFREPTQSDAWTPARMEYAFAVGAAGDAGSFTAREYDGGALDWHTFDQSAAAITGGTAQRVTTTRRVPVAPVTFRGMPARRFWELEDASVDLAALTAGAEDLGRLLLRDFVLIYGNDWFLFPLAVPVGTAVNLDSLVVTDTFGVTTTVPHYAAADGATGRWRMFSLSADPTDPDATPDDRLLVLPSAVTILDGAPIEDVRLLRDEAADLVWGIENSVVGPAGTPLDRALVWRTNASPPAPPAPDHLPRYRLGSVVPDYWYPFLPVNGDGTHLQVCRGKVPTSSSQPLGRMLGGEALTMFLDEIPREGVHLERRYRYTRGLDGSSFLWVSRRRSTGRGSGRSGLQFDYLEG